MPSSAPPRTPSLPPAPPPRRDDGAHVLAKAHTELRAAQIEVERLREQLKGRDAHIQELKTSLASGAAEAAKLRADVDGKTAALTAAEAELNALRAQQQAASAVDAGDDLKQIRGIGAGYERTLKQNGVSNYAQIAAWTGDDILRIAAILNTQPGRIVRGAWIEQATAIVTPAGES